MALPQYTGSVINTGRGDDYGRDYSGFTNLWYTFEYHCQDGTRPALDMGLTKGCLEVEQVE